jgi:hypothetical protein
MLEDLEKKLATEIVIDLEEELEPAELASFRERAEAEGSKDLTEHFKRVFLSPDRAAS